MILPAAFDFKKPDYLPIFDSRKERLERIRADTSGESLMMLRAHYKHDPAQFITDWGMTSDPRNPGRGLPSVIPFLLFPKQEEWINRSVEAWKNQEPLLTVKSREMGVTWLAVALAVTLCTFYDGMTISFASRKEILVDHLGDPDCIFYKIRQFTALLPKEFRGSWNEKKDAPYMRVFYPDSSSVIKGEAGRDIGRGGRAAIVFVDESASLSHQEEIDASLSQTTNSRQDISTPKGMNNSFARKRFGNKVPWIQMHWTDDPRKDNEWYLRQKEFLDDDVLIAQELDCDFSRSLQGVIIPVDWVNAAIDAHLVLGIEPTGIRKAGLDLADQGRDKNAQVFRHGLLNYRAEMWSGKGSDIMYTIEKAGEYCDEEEIDTTDYDADGLGAGARGDARVLNAKRAKCGLNPIIFNPYHGSAGVINPKEEVFRRSMYDNSENVRSRKNEDYFRNFKAQSWYHVRRKFMMTYRAVIEKREYNPEDIISIASTCKNLHQLKTEVSQATMSWDDNDKMIVDKAPDGMLSPNLADALIIVNAPQNIRKGFYDVS